MNLTRNRVRSIGWVVVLTICAAMTFALTFRVNAVKSEVRLAERQIIAAKRDKQFLETEFQTRANQQQLAALNNVEFGYTAPTAGQYLEGERQLASLGKPRAADAPVPIRVAAALPVSDNGGFPAMVSPLSGKAMAAEVPKDGAPSPAAAQDLDARLSAIEHGAARE